MTVVPFPPASARPKPGKEPPDAPAKILVFLPIAVWRDLPPDPETEAFLAGMGPVLSTMVYRHDGLHRNCRCALTAFDGTEAEAHAWIDAAIAGDLSSTLPPAVAPKI